MNLRQRTAFLINFAYFAVILGIAIFMTRVGIFRVMPFFIAFLVAYLLQPLVRFLHQRCRIHKSVAGVVVVILFYATVGLALTFLGIKLVAAAKSLIVLAPSAYSSYIDPAIGSIFDALGGFVARLSPEQAVTYDAIFAEFSSTLTTAVSSLSMQLVGKLTNVAFSLPGFLLNMIICVIATVFLCKDLTVVRAFVNRQLSDKKRELVANIRIHLRRTLGRYTKAYALILLITFAEIAVGLSIVGIDNALLIALVIAVFDILPVVGSGLVLFPWTVITLLSGNYLRALGLGIVWIVVVVVRQIIEPKIVGDKVGVHPIVTLLSMVVGTYVFGPLGLLGLPITVALLKSLNDNGVIHLFKNVTKDEAEAEENDAYVRRQSEKASEKRTAEAEAGTDDAPPNSFEHDEPSNAPSEKRRP